MTKRLMIVDDEVHTLLLVKRMLEKDGYSVNTACDGRECLTKIQDYPADLVLLDIMMPGPPPKEIIKQLRNLPQPPRVVYFSALGADDETSKRLRRNLVDEDADDIVAGFLEKPFTHDELLHAIEGALQQ